MKTTTRNMMMSLVLMGGMVLSASTASAQMSGRQRPSTNNSPSTTTTSRGNSDNRQTVAPSRQSSVRNGNATSMGSRTQSRTDARSAAPQTQSRPSTVTTRPSTGTTTSPSRPSTVTSRPSTVTTRPSTGSTTTTRPSTVTARPSTITPQSQTTTPGSVRNRRPVTPSDNGSGSVTNPSRPDNGGGNGNRPGNRPGNGGGHNGNGGHIGDGHGNRPGGNHGGGHGHRPDPRSHPHYNDFRYNFSHNNWSRPLPPPVRPYRPAPLRYYRPVVPVHYRPYAGAPIIDRILGLTFGTLFDVSLNYLYSNNYYIDGYETGVVYLRDVMMLNLLWPDVMLCYDDYGRLANAQFVISTGYADRSRYNRLYHDLSAVYGPPVSVDNYGATWFGGNTTGYVTLTLGSNNARYYTTLSVGY